MKIHYKIGSRNTCINVDIRVFKANVIKAIVIYLFNERNLLATSILMQEKITYECSNTIYCGLRPQTTVKVTKQGDVI